MNYIVIDFEFNQAFNFAKNCKGISDKNCNFEIIQIGAIKLDENFNEIDKFNALVKPNIYKNLHPHVSKITGFTNETFINAKHFVEVYKKFLKFLGNDYIFCTWGKMDIKIFFKNLLFYNIDITNISKKYVDVQSIISKKISNNSKALVGLRNACGHFNIINEDIIFHDAYNDAYYTKELMLKAKPSKKNICHFRTSELVKKTIGKRGKINTDKIYSIAEKSLNRQLTPKEQEVVLSIYNLGRNKQCDF